ncbi:MAG: tetratricopeptide repeat protein [bacterium]
MQSLSQTSFNNRQAGIQFLRDENFIEALAQLNLAIVREPGSAELYYFRGYAKYGLDDLIGAEQDYTRSIELFPYSPDVLISRAVVRGQLMNEPGALEDFGRAETLDSTNAELFFQRAKIHLYAKHFNDCINDCYKAIQQQYPDENVYLLKGNAELGLSHFYTAIASFRKAVNLNPENPFCYLQLGTAWLELNQVDSALFFLDKAYLLDSTNTYILFTRALVLARKPDYPAAIINLNTVISRSPYNSYAYFNRAILKNEQEKTEDAIRDLTIVLQLNPSNITSYYYRALMKMELKDYPSALEDLNRTLELYPDHAEACQARSQVKTKLKDPAGARADYLAAMKLYEKNNIPPDSLSPEKVDYLKSLVSLSGTFEEMNTMEGKFQNQFIDIQFLPLFRLFQGTANYDQLRFYDAYRKPHYHSHLITLTNHAELISDSLAQTELANTDSLILRTPDDPELHLRKALSFAALNRFNQAFDEFDLAQRMDSVFALLYFTRANTRYELIKLITSLNDYQNQITIGNPDPSFQEQIRPNVVEHTYEEVLADYSRAIGLDPAFPYAWYNRGVVNGFLGEYDDALSDFLQALNNNPQLGEAHYNIGLIYLLKQNTEQGCEHLSKAGELGVADAYKVMKRHCYK